MECGLCTVVYSALSITWDDESVSGKSYTEALFITGYVQLPSLIRTHLFWIRLRIRRGNWKNEGAVV